MAKKRMPRVGPRNPCANSHGFPVARLTVRAKGVARGRKGKGFTGRTLSVRDVSEERSLLDPVTGQDNTKFNYRRSVGLYPADHPLMVRANLLAESR